LEDLAAALRIQGSDIESLLIEESYRFEFYQAVKLLDLIYRRYLNEAGKDPDRDIHGEIFDPEMKGVRFTSNIEPVFPASEIDSITVPLNPINPYEMLVNFLGLVGITGPMPETYTQILLDMEKIDPSNRAFSDFLDIFNHRLISLLYQVRKKHRFGFEFKKPEDTSFAKYFYSLIGMGTDDLRNRLHFGEPSLLYYIGLFSNRNRSIAGLEYILSDYFNIKVVTRTFLGNWRIIEKNFVTRLGFSGQNQILGKSVTLGNRTWDQEARFEIKIGPVNVSQFIDFIPLKDSRASLPLYELTRHYSGLQYEFDYVFIIDPIELKPAVLSDEKTSRLGWTTWIPPEPGRIFDFDFLLFVETEDKLKTTLSDGTRVRLGWTVWVPDTESKKEYIEVRISSNEIKNQLNAS